MVYDCAHQIAGFAVRIAPGADASADEAAAQGVFASLGGITNPITQTFGTWDGYGAVKAVYNWGGGDDIKARADAVARAFLGAGVGGTWNAGAGAVGPFVLQVEYVHRSGRSALMVGACVAAAG